MYEISGRETRNTARAYNRKDGGNPLSLAQLPAPYTISGASNMAALIADIIVSAVARVRARARASVIRRLGVGGWGRGKGLPR